MGVRVWRLGCGLLKFEMECFDSTFTLLLLR